MSLILSGTDGVADVDGSAATPAIRGTDTNTGIFFPAADTIAFAEGGVESARFDSAGNLGIGTTSPGVRLHVASSGSEVARFATSGADMYLRFVNSFDTNGYIGYQNAAMTFWTANNLRATLDSSGNLGLGVTPSAWSNGYKALQIGQSSLSSVGNAVYVWQNIYQDSGGTNRYISTGTAGLTGWEGNTYKWYQAPSGTAGTAVSVTQPMALDASGNLLVGRTSAFSSDTRANIQAPSGGNGMGVQVGSNGNYAIYINNTSGATVGGIIGNSGSVSYNTTSDYRLKEDIQPMTGSLAKVAALKPCTYTWKATGEAAQGFIAHELAEVVPDCVSGEKDAVDAEGNPQYQGIDTSFLVATLTAAIQEQQALINAQQAALQTLTARVTALDARLISLEGTQP